MLLHNLQSLMVSQRKPNKNLAITVSDSLSQPYFCFYSQLTLILMSVLRAGWAEMALLVTSHRNIAPSSCLLGMISSTLTVLPSLWSGRLVLPVI